MVYVPKVRLVPVMPARRPTLRVSVFDWVGSKSPPSLASTKTGPEPSSTLKAAATFWLSISLVFSWSPSFQVTLLLSE
jgi:hypothetical protein